MVESPIAHDDPELEEHVISENVDLITDFHRLQHFLDESFHTALSAPDLDREVRQEVRHQIAAEAIDQYLMQQSEAFWDEVADSL